VRTNFRIHSYPRDDVDDLAAQDADAFKAAPSWATVIRDMRDKEDLHPDVKKYIPHPATHLLYQY